MEKTQVIKEKIGKIQRVLYGYNTIVNVRAILSPELWKVEQLLNDIEQDLATWEQCYNAEVNKPKDNRHVKVKECNA